MKGLSKKFGGNKKAQPAATGAPPPQKGAPTVDEVVVKPQPPIPKGGEILRVKILRGRNLIARDVIKGTSDVYCKVYVDDKLKGETTIISRTLNPVWSDEHSEFHLKVRPTSEVKIRILDNDSMLFGLVASSDDPMGLVKIPGSAIPLMNTNKWIKVVPDENECECSGELEVQVTRGDGPRPPPPPPAFTQAAKSRVIRPGPRVYAEGPKQTLLGMSAADLLLRAANSPAPVWLHVYDVGHSGTIATLNRVTEQAVGGGVFHGAIEVHGRELSFGGCRQNKCGIFACKPRQCPMHAYRESAYLGDCGLTKEEVQDIVNTLKPKWWGPSYDLLQKNCCSFSREFALSLGVGDVPSWIDRLAKWGTALQGQKKGEVTEPSDQDLLFMEHVMASRVQSRFRTRKWQRIVKALKAGK